MTATAIGTNTNDSMITISKSLATGIAHMIATVITFGDSETQIVIAIGTTLGSGKDTSSTAICVGMRTPLRANSSAALRRRREAGVTSLSAATSFSLTTAGEFTTQFISN